MLTFAALSMLALARAQQVGTETSESHPKITWQRCTAPGQCTNVNGEIVIDANWRWVHEVGGYENCYDGNQWTDLCSSASDCAKNCAVEGADYSGTYGITTSGDALTLSFVTEHEYGKNIGARTYLMESDSKYQMFTLMDNELAFDVDLSAVECGMNSALYLVPMKPDGGLSDEPDNEAGAKYGLGYCDAQCARDLKFINGKANIEGWTQSATDENSGLGNMGSCCAEIDVWESNAHAYAFTPHACEENTYHVCNGDDECGGTYSPDRFNGKCDANGCDYNPYRLGNHDFYGQGASGVDTTKKFTVISRYETDKLSMLFIQDGKVIEVPGPKLEGLDHFDNTITPEYCAAYPPLFEDHDRHNEVGGTPALNEALRLPMVLVLSIWADHYASMLWLDSLYPPEKEGIPGTLRGPCPQTGRDPADVVSNHADAKVIWSNIRYGPIGSTHDTGGI
ncbi:Exoglucanase 1 [Scedosporium apiospermum]|uniref:Glucanase n=1 Tax=Pseudallescheria apiosperma TaxID=563466 RepID=A0A084G7F7_PSEDA|nr:Exoglucanase 1 [Scedosporium apiospermum]KEZ43269.1 Exoglucanase 1 [Scedosporium apiospermum]